MTSKAGLSGLGLVYLTGGAILLWSGVSGQGFGAIFKSALGGKATPVGTGANSLSGVESSDLSTTGTGSTTPATGTGGSVGTNQAIAKVLAAPYGWSTGQEWDDLVNLWERESSWSNTATNPSSGAYGIPQALPASKMGTLANPPTSSATAQISWGLSYIKSTYGDPINAWGHELADGWY
jgi:hypothetical protein